MSGPGGDDIEVTLLGPGFGESILVHIGGGRWIAIDSCIDKDTKGPAALAYLKSIGVSENAVELIVATHWHDDHIKCMGQFVSRCDQAEFCSSAILTNEEFVAYVFANDQRPMTKASSGVHEMRKVLEARQGKSVVRALKNRLLKKVPGSELPHGQDVEIWSLSPSDHSYDRFIQSIAGVFPKKYQQKKRVPNIEPNECSVVIWVSIGPIGMLLGADLEESGHADGGWSSIVGSTEKPAGRAAYFKIPHHGSSNGHHEQVWETMVAADAVCALTPFGKGKKLPQPEDIKRITNLSDRSYSTAKLDPKQKKKKRSATVDKFLKQTGYEVRPLLFSMGRVTARISMSAHHNGFAVECGNGALRLKELLTA